MVSQSLVNKGYDGMEGVDKENPTFLVALAGLARWKGGVRRKEFKTGGDLTLLNTLWIIAVSKWMNQ